MTSNDKSTWADWAEDAVSKTPETSDLGSQKARSDVSKPRDKAIAERVAEMPGTSVSTYLKATRGKASPRIAIKAFCMECVGWKRAEVAGCTAVACPLWMYRPFRKEGRDNG